MKFLNSSILNSLVLCLVLSIAVSSCKKDDVLEPRISQLKICDAAPADEILCASDKSVFAPSDPAFYASAKFEGITKDTEVTFTMYGKDSDGNWVVMTFLTFKPSDQGTFDDETAFDLSTNFTKSATQAWPVSDYKIEAQIEVADGPSAENEFSVQ